MGGSVYPSKDKWLTHSGGDTGYSGKTDADIRRDSRDSSIISSTTTPKKKPTLSTKPRIQQGQLLDSTGKMTKARALAIGSDRSARGSR